MKKNVIGCLGGAVLFVVIFAVVVGVWLSLEFPVLNASLSVPTQASRDATIAMVITATNDHDKPITLDSVDIDDSFLEGFQVISIHPEPTDTMKIFGQRSWFFERSVDPGESLEVRFELKAVMEGHFSGDVHVCNPNQDVKTLIADVVVRKEDANEPENNKNQ